MRDVLCVGGTGTVGSLVVEGLIARGASVRCMTRSQDRAGTSDGAVRYVFGDLEHPESLGPVFEGMTRVHLLTPVHPNEARLGVAAVEAARAGGAERIVLHSVHGVDDGAQIPHFASKIEILAAIETSGIPWATIEPNHYYQNDLWLRQAILEAGVYPFPIGHVGLSRVDVRDIADGTVNALLDDGHEGNRYPLVGPFVLTGEEVARIWSERLGRPGGLCRRRYRRVGRGRPGDDAGLDGGRSPDHVRALPRSGSRRVRGGSGDHEPRAGTRAADLR